MIQETTVDSYGNEVHPGFAKIGAARVSSGTGKVLFDSDIRHGQYVVLRVEQAYRSRDISRDYIGGGKRLVEVAMSEAQWASFVSSMNTEGVPATLEYYNGEDMPDLPYAPRLAHTMKETHDAARKAFDEANRAMAAYEEALKSGTAKEKREALRTLKFTLQNAVPNVDYAGKTLAAHAENVVQRARADVEAMVTSKAAQLAAGSGSAAPLALDTGFLDAEVVGEG